MAIVSKDATVATIRNYIEENLLDGDAVDNEADLIMSGVIDSLDIVHLITFIQSEFDIKIPPTEITVENFSSINKIADYLQQQST